MCSCTGCSRSASHVSIAALALVLAAPAAAFADDEAPAPSFVTLDRADGSTRFGIEGSVEAVNNSNITTVGEKLTGGRLDIHGQYVAPQLGLGGYLTMPFSFMGVSYDGASNHYAALGDLEAGAIYALRLPLAGLGLPIHVGVAVPTGSTSATGFSTNRDDVYPRFTDFPLNYPEGTTLRIAASPTYDSEYVFARIDLGFDLTFASSADDNGATMNVVTNNLFRLNAAIGVKLGALTVSLESTNTYFIPNHGESNPDGIGSSWVDTGALALRLRTDYVEPYVAVEFPLDHQSKYDFDVAFTLGIELRRPPHRTPEPPPPDDADLVPDPPAN